MSHVAEQMSCEHATVECLNHYEFFRKYRCAECAKVFVCSCEQELATSFLPHQAKVGTEFGTQRRVPVDDFAPVCAACRGAVELPHPKAQTRHSGGKVERYYWREIFRTYCERILSELGGDFPYTDVVEFEAVQPQVAQRLRREARKSWQDVHRRTPRYDTHEKTQAQFLGTVKVPLVHVCAEYAQIEKAGGLVGRWVSKDGTLVSVEDLVERRMREGGEHPLRCERKLISVWVATFFGVAIQDAADPLCQIGMRNSTVGWTPSNRNTPLIRFRCPRDFGSPAYYERRAAVLDTWTAGVRGCRDVLALYGRLLEETELIRDYLWVADGAAVELGRVALEVIPCETVALMIDWAIRSFWERQPGWPDFLVRTAPTRKPSYRFSEVKSPGDVLSLQQMRWLEWAVKNEIPCELIMVKRSRESDGEWPCQRA